MSVHQQNYLNLVLHERNLILQFDHLTLVLLLHQHDFLIRALLYIVVLLLVVLDVLLLHLHIVIHILDTLQELSDLVSHFFILLAHTFLHLCIVCELQLRIRFVPLHRLILFLLGLDQTALQYGVAVSQHLNRSKLFLVLCLQFP